MEPTSTASAVRTAIGVFVLGGVGALVRVTSASFLDRLLAQRLPHVGTLAVNLLGCLLFGFLGGLLTGTARVVVLGGLLGALTTYSTFAWLLVDLGRSGRFATLAIHTATHLVGGTGCVVLGLFAARVIARNV